MYGKKFIAALMFLAVAEIDVNAYGHNDGYGGYGDEEETILISAAHDYIPAPESSIDLDYAVEVPIPEGYDFDIKYALFGLEMVEDDSAVWDWANKLAARAICISTATKKCPSRKLRKFIPPCNYLLQTGKTHRPTS